MVWSYQVLRGSDTTEADLARAEAASEWLASLVTEGSTAVVLTHGVFRRLVGKQLVRRGWRSAGRDGGYRHWSAWSFSRPAGNAIGPTGQISLDAAPARPQGRIKLMRAKAGPPLVEPALERSEGLASG